LYKLGAHILYIDGYTVHILYIDGYTVHILYIDGYTVHMTRTLIMEVIYK